MPTCQIQWLNENGEPTPDTNPAIGRVQWPRGVEQIEGRRVEVSDSSWFHICADHARQLSDPEMAHWVFEPYVASEE